MKRRKERIKKNEKLAHDERYPGSEVVLLFIGSLSLQLLWAEKVHGMLKTLESSSDEKVELSAPGTIINLLLL